MKIAVIGLGSMGKRRIRCLQAIGGHEIFGFDVRPDRRKETEATYQVSTYDSVESILQQKPQALVISVPPDKHEDYMKLCVENGLHFFVEASVVQRKMAELASAVSDRNLVGVPSCTMLFHPGVAFLVQSVKEREIGKVSNFSFHSGQYLPDWHTYEPVDEYYVSNPSTGGGREIVPFELTWLIMAFGFPKRVCGTYGSTILIDGAEYIDDSYSFVLDYGNFFGTVVVDVSSRFATRRLLLNGSEQQLRWDWEENQIKTFDPSGLGWSRHEYNSGEPAPGYNANIGEFMYIREVEAFLGAIEGMRTYPTTLEYDLRILELLEKIERSSLMGQWVVV